MFKSLKRITLYAAGLYLGLAILHLWLNVGFDKLGLSGTDSLAEELKFRVGFLPVT